MCEQEGCENPAIRDYDLNGVARFCDFHHNLNLNINIYEENEENFDDMPPLTPVLSSWITEVVSFEHFGDFGDFEG